MEKTLIEEIESFMPLVKGVEVYTKADGTLTIKRQREVVEVTKKAGDHD